MCPGRPGHVESCLCISTFTLRLLSPLTHQLVNELQSHPSSLWHLIKQPIAPGRGRLHRDCFRGRSVLVHFPLRLSFLSHCSGTEGEGSAPLFVAVWGHVRRSLLFPVESHTLFGWLIRTVIFNNSSSPLLNTHCRPDGW